MDLEAEAKKSPWINALWQILWQILCALCGRIHPNSRINSKRERGGNDNPQFEIGLTFTFFFFLCGKTDYPEGEKNPIIFLVFNMIQKE